MNGEYLHSRTPGATGNFSTNFKDYPGGVEYFEVYHGPITSHYGEVWWTSTSNDLPPDVVKRFDGKVMAIVGLEMDQVRKGAGPSGEDVSLPITLAYNHHHDTAVVGSNTELEELDMHDRRLAESPYGNRHFVRLDHGKVWAPKRYTTTAGNPTSAMFSDGNGGEYRKTLHMAPPGFAQLVESPARLSGSPMQIDTWNRDKMDINGGPFVPGPVPKRALAPLTGPDAVYSGLLECPLTTRIRKHFDGGASGWNDTVSAAVFACPAPAPPHGPRPACQKKAGNNCSGCGTEADCRQWFVPGAAGGEFNCVWKGGKCAESTAACSGSGPAPKTACEHQVDTAAACFAAAKQLNGLRNATVSTKTVSDSTTPPGCSIAASAGGDTATAVFNTKADSAACCSPGDAIVGTARSLVTLSLSVSPKNATITMTGPAAVWFGVGFDATLMDDMPYAIIVEGGATGMVSERRLAKESPGAPLNASVAVVSNTVVGGVRTVVLTRPRKGMTSQHYSFSTTTLGISFINAVGSSATLSYHKAKTASSIALFPANGQPACLCAFPAAAFGQATGTFEYLPTGETIGFKAGRCAPEPREDVLAARNPTCDVRTYVGGLMSCHHGWVILDQEQEQPWMDQPLVYFKKFRIYYQEYDPKKHLNLERQDWGIGADGDHSEYDVIQCPAGTPPSKCTNLNQGTWMPHAAVAPGQPGLHLVKAHFHCHAPTCLRMELWNNDTGKLLCREEAVHGGTGQLDLHKFDEKGYIAMPPCLWGSAEDGLEPPPLISGVNIRVTSLTNATYGHHGEMALPEMSLVQLPASK